MKRLRNITYHYQPSELCLTALVWVAVLLTSFFSTACKDSVKAENVEKTGAIGAVSFTDEQPALPHAGNLVEVKTEHMNFIMPDEIPSGWTTFRYHNKSSLTHFMLVDKLPVFEGEQKTLEHYKEVGPVFVDAMDLINAGKAKEGFAEFARLPAWFSEVIFSGGVGLVSPGNTAQTTIYLKPGVYIAECYVKTGGKFHPMTKQFTVSKQNTDASAPKPTLEISVSRDKGIVLNQEVKPGPHTIAVHFEDQTLHEHFMGHDVHLVKLDEKSDLEELNNWMNWAEPKGLNTPAPVNFIGGAQEMPAGNTAYFAVNLEPGYYAWVAEVPDPKSKNMLKRFRVSDGNEMVKR